MAGVRLPSLHGGSPPGKKMRDPDRGWYDVSEGRRGSRVSAGEESYLDAPDRELSPRGRREPVESIVGPDGEAQISLLTPTRLLPPAHFNTPPRAPFPVHVLRTSRVVTDALFERLKRKAKMRAAATRRSGDRSHACIADFNRGVTNDNGENFLQAISCYKAFLEHGAETIEDQCLGLNAIGITYYCMGDLETSLGFHAEHAQIATDNRSRMVALCNVGLLERELGQLVDSDRCFEQARDLALQEEDAAGEMLASAHLGVNAFLSPEGTCVGRTACARVGSIPQDRLARAKEMLEAQRDQQQPFDDPRNLSVVHEGLGVLAHASGSFREAEEHFTEARTVARWLRDGERGNLDKCNVGIARAHVRWRQAIQARVKEASEIAQTHSRREARVLGKPELIRATARDTEGDEHDEEEQPQEEGDGRGK